MHGSMFFPSQSLASVCCSAAIWLIDTEIKIGRLNPETDRSAKHHAPGLTMSLVMRGGVVFPAVVQLRDKDWQGC